MTEGTIVSAPRRRGDNVGSKEGLTGTTPQPAVAYRVTWWRSETFVRAGRYVAGVVAFAGALYAVGYLDEVVARVPDVGGFWLANGFGLVVLYLGGLRWWPGLVIGQVANAYLASLTPTIALGLTLPALLSVIVGPILGALILRRLAGERAAMNRLSDVGGVLVACAACEGLGATVAAVDWWASGFIAASGVWGYWREFVLGGLAADLVLVPLVLAWWARPLDSAWRKRVGEAVAMLATVVALSAIAVSSRGPVPLTYLVFPAFLWAALRFGPQAATVALALSATIVVWATATAHGPFATGTPADAARDLQLYLTIAALTTLSLAAIVSERRRAAVEVVESRARLAEAGSRERRKLERDLHDGAQQRLVAASINLSLAGELADGIPELHERVSDAGSEIGQALAELQERVSEAGAEIEQALAELREVAHGIYPQALGRWGLARAFDVLASRYPGRVKVTTATAGRFPPEVEAAMYYCCSEAVQNASKHAGPDVHISIRLTMKVDRLHLEVRDNGPGFDVAVANGGIGLQNMRDRLGAVRGSVKIVSDPGHGTLISAIAPLPHET